MSYSNGHDFSVNGRVRERAALWVIALAGLLGPNGIFVYHVLFRPEVLLDALANPVALAFIAEALLLVPLLAYLFSRWRVSTLGWGWFAGFSLLGGLLFAIPVFLLLRRGASEESRKE